MKLRSLHVTMDFLKKGEGPFCCLVFEGTNKQPSKLTFFLSGHLATDCSGLVASEKF